MFDALALLLYVDVLCLDIHYEFVVVSRPTFLQIGIIARNVEIEK